MKKFTKKLSILFASLAMVMGVGLVSGKAATAKTTVNAATEPIEIYASGIPNFGTGYAADDHVINNVTWYFPTAGNNTSFGWNKSSQDKTDESVLGPLSEVKESTKYGFYQKDNGFSNAQKFEVSISNLDSVTGSYYIFYSTDKGGNWYLGIKGDLESSTSLISYDHKSAIGNEVYFALGIGTSKTTKTRIDLINIKVYKPGEETVDRGAITELNISGDLENKSYSPSDEWNPSGLKALAKFENTGDEEIDVTSGTKWTFDPEKPSIETKTLNVTGSYMEMQSNKLTIDGITVVDVKILLIQHDDTFEPALPTSTDSVNANATEHTDKTSNLKFKEAGIYRSASSTVDYIMFKENEGYLYNTESLGTILSISITYSGNTSESAKIGVYFSDKECSTYDTSNNIIIKGRNQTDTFTNNNSSNGFFQISTSNKNCQITKIEIEYREAGLNDPSIRIDQKIPLWMHVNDNMKFTATTTNADDTIISWSVDNDTVAQINGEGQVTTKEEGSFKVTAKITVNGKDYSATTSEIQVIDLVHDGTLDDPFSVADALKVCEKVGSTDSVGEYYIKGFVISAPELYSNKTLTFYIADEISDNINKLYLYDAKNIGGKDFTSTDEVSIGDIVIGFGHLVKYSDKTPELNKGTLTSITTTKDQANNFIAHWKTEIKFDQTNGAICDLFTAGNTSTVEKLLEEYDGLNEYVKPLVDETVIGEDVNNDVVENPNAITFKEHVEWVRAMLEAKASPSGSDASRFTTLLSNKDYHTVSNILIISALTLVTILSYVIVSKKRRID